MPRSGYGSTFGFFMGVVSLVLLGAFVYKSVAKVMVLKPEPPAEFLDVQPGWSAKQRQAEKQLARAYWEAARRISRTSQGFGDRLPEEPPGEFSVDASAHPSVIEPAAAARMRYWRNLRKVWNNPNAWQTTYKWYTGWLTGLSY